MALVPEIFILTGFLGSGKTTLLVDMLATDQYANTAFIVNDIGEINIDHATVLSSGPGLQVANLENGCVCCTIAGDLPLTVAALMDENERRGSAPLERIVIETSGLSRPAPIIRQLLGLPIPFRVSVICTYDCVHGSLSGANFEEAAAQLAAAQTVVLTKLDEVDDAQRLECIERLSVINPFAKLVDEGRGQGRVRQAFTPVPANPALWLETFRHTETNMGDHRVSVCLATARRPLSVDQLFEWLDNMGAHFGPRLLRSKGIFRPEAGSTTILVQSVGSFFERPQAVDVATSAECIVLILRDLEVGELDTISPTGLMKLVDKAI